MPKPSTSTATELVIAGQPSIPLLLELRSAGEKITIANLAEALVRVERARGQFVADAVATGIMLLAKKQTIDHGGWQPFCALIWEQITKTEPKWETVSHLDGALHNFTRSLRGYCFLAQHFLADLDQKSFAPDGNLPPTPPPVATSEVLALSTLSHDKRAAVYTVIENWIGGRSLRRMLIDFRRAENAAEQEEALEKTAAANRKGKGKKPDAPGQLFMNEIMDPIGKLDAMFEDKTLRKLSDKEDWMTIAKKLRSQADRAERIAKEIAS